MTRKMAVNALFNKPQDHFAAKEKQCTMTVLDSCEFLLLNSICLDCGIAAWHPLHIILFPRTYQLYQSSKPAWMPKHFVLFISVLEQYPLLCSLNMITCQFGNRWGERQKEKPGQRDCEELGRNVVGRRKCWGIDTDLCLVSVGEILFSVLYEKVGVYQKACCVSSWAVKQYRRLFLIVSSSQACMAYRNPHSLKKTKFALLVVSSLVVLVWSPSFAYVIVKWQ